MLLVHDRHRISYDLIGPERGPVVCFTHSLASDSGMWAEQMPTLLAAEFRVLRIDMRGHGGSEAVSGDYSMDMLAGDVAAVLQALGIDQVHLIGLSIGGMIGQALAIRHGTRLASAMLCDTLPATQPNAREAWEPRIEVVKRTGSLRALAQPTMERWFTDHYKSRNSGRWRQIHDTIAATTSQGFLGCAAAILGFDFTPALPSLKVPLLVVCGADDQGTPPAENKRLAGLVPGGRYQEIAGARHLANVEQPETFNRIMMEWLAARQ